MSESWITVDSTCKAQ